MLHRPVSSTSQDDEHKRHKGCKYKLKYGSLIVLRGHLICDARERALVLENLELLLSNACPEGLQLKTGILELSVLVGAFIHQCLKLASGGLDHIVLLHDNSVSSAPNSNGG